MNPLFSDTALALRTLRKRPFVVAVAIVSLALGVASCATFFGLVDLLSLRPLSVPHPNELVSLSIVSPHDPPPSAEDPRANFSVSIPLFQALERRSDLFSGVFAWNASGLNTLDSEGGRYLGTIDDVSGEFFRTMSVHPIMGRPIEPGDVALSSGQSARVAVISYRCWQERYGGERDVIGKTFTVNGVPLTIVGVTGPDFPSLRRGVTPEAAVPMGFTHPRGVHGPVNVTARLRPGVSIARARAAIAAASPGLLAQFGADGADSFSNPKRADQTTGRKLVLLPEWRGVSSVRQQYGKSALLLLGLAGLVFLVACLNLSTLILARANARAPEFRIRLAIGATRWRILRLVLLDVLLISAAGTAIGVWIANWCTKLLIAAFWDGFVPVSVQMRPSVGALALSGLAALFIATAIGVIPALRIARLTPSQPATRTSLAGMTRRGTISTWLAAFEAAFALVLVALALTLGTNVYRTEHASAGYDRDHVLAMYLYFQGSPAALPPGGPLYYENLAARLAALPGVESVAYSAAAPVFPGDTPTPVSGGRRSAHAFWAWTGPGFFHLLKIPVVAGRDFNWNDNAESGRVAVISETLATRLFPGQNPVGQEVEFSLHGPAKSYRVVGVAADAALWQPDARDSAAIYIPLAANCSPCTPLVLIRTRGSPMALARASETVARSSGYQYSMRTQSLRQMFAKSLTGQRFASWLAIDFALIALGLASLGLYALISFRVAERNQEIAIRMALGAQGRQILGLILKEAVMVVVAGIVVAIPLVAAAMRVLAANGASMPPHVLVEEIGGAAIVIVAALLAVYAPASRACKTNPASSLRQD